MAPQLSRTTPCRHSRRSLPVQNSPTVPEADSPVTPVTLVTLVTPVTFVTLVTFVTPVTIPKRNLIFGTDSPLFTQNRQLMAFRILLGAWLLATCAPLLPAQPLDYLRMQGCRYANEGYLRPVLTDEERLLVCGSNARSDSIDVLHYDIRLDVTDFAAQQIQAACTVTFTPKTASISAIPLDLLDLTVDSVLLGGQAIPFDYDGLLLHIGLPNPALQGDTVSVTVHYHGHPTADPSGFGGFVFQNNIAYNLGIGLASNPYNFGRSWHPCFDNFVERATYDLHIISHGGRKAYAIGQLVSAQSIGGDTLVRHYRMDIPLPTYLVGSATSTYIEHHDTHTGTYGPHPVLLVGKPADSLAMVNAFAYLGAAIDALEAWYGPYIWGQVGYVMTTRGAMEHATLIAYPVSSIASGATPAMNRLMAHELAHHWWGNITTLSCPSDMWIKEGNAEYGAHLFTEFAFGKDAFIEQVRSNHYNVLQNAHRDDGGNFLPLSGIPYEYTYGTHTYNKGASVMHNLRGYLGDSLFQKGMRSILDTYGLAAVDAQQFRDQLSATTGVDLEPFFDDWIYSPGFATYELDSARIQPADVPEEFEVTLFIHQKLRAAPHFHTHVPLEVSFFDEHWQPWHTTVEVSGEFSQPVVNVPFEPVWIALNDRNRLNLASMQSRKTVYTTGDLSLPYTDLVTFSITNLPDSALVNVIHFWAAPDPIEPNPTGVQMSATHFWRLDGILPQGFKARATLQYRGANPLDFDYDLTHGNEDSLILVWRPRPGVPWKQYPWYKKLTLGGSTDGNGFIRIDTMLPGDYAFANGHLDIASSSNQANPPLDVLLWPNPSQDHLYLHTGPSLATTARLEILDPTGRLLSRKALSGQLHHIDVSALPPGLYLLRLFDSTNHLRSVSRFVIQRN